MVRSRWAPRRAASRRAVAIAAVLLLASGAASCGDGGSDGMDGDAGGTGGGSPDGYAVTRLTETFVDDTRPTEDPEDERDAGSRTLETDLYVPEGDGPFPLVVHAHGFDGNPGKYSELLATWARAGYVIAAPAFPLTNDLTDVPGVLTDYAAQPADVAFVIDEVLAMADSDHPDLGDRIDPETIGVSGHSLGGITAYGLVYHDCCRDERVDAALVMSSLPLPFEDGSYEFRGTPLMLLLSTGDPIIPYEDAMATYEGAGDPKILVTLEGDGHAPPYEDTASVHDGLVERTTTSFWDAYLGDDPDAVRKIVDAAEAHDATTVTTSGVD